MKTTILFSNYQNIQLKDCRNIENFSLLKKLYETSQDFLNMELLENFEIKTIFPIKRALHNFIFNIFNFQKLKKDNFQDISFAGYSLGEISALVCSESISFQEGLYLVYKIAKSIFKISKILNYKSIVILGLNKEELQNIIDQTYHLLWISSFIEERKIIVSGMKKGIEILIYEVSKKNKNYFFISNIENNTPMMLQEKKYLYEKIETINFLDSKYFVYQNFDGKREKKNTYLKNKLKKIITNPINWHQTILNIKKNNDNIFNLSYI